MSTILKTARKHVIAAIKYYASYALTHIKNNEKITKYLKYIINNIERASSLDISIYGKWIAIVVLISDIEYFITIDLVRNIVNLVTINWSRDGIERARRYKANIYK